MTISGDVNATNVGEYTVTFTPKKGYEWSNGDVSPKSVTWNISKATPVVTIDTTSIQYGTTLSDVKPNVTSNTPGTFAWINTDEEFSKLSVGNNIIKWKFTPSDTSNYNELESNSNIEITAIPTDIPTFNSLSCDGNSFSPVFDGYDESKMTMDGTMSANTIGTYKVTFDLKDKEHYEWSNNDSSSKTLQWNIDEILDGTITRSNKNKIGYVDGIEELNIHKYFVDNNIAYKSTNIEDEAFQSYTSLTKVIIPDTISKIGNNAFNECNSLTNITIPDSVIYIGGNAFLNTPWLTAKQQENALVVVNNILIDGKTYKGYATIPSGVTKISPSAFSRCYELTGITIPNSVIEMGESAFSVCTKLKYIIIPNSITNLDKYSFYYCNSLETIDMSNKISTIGEEVFHGCDKLTTVYYNGKQEDWDKTTIGTKNDPLINATKKFYDRTLVINSNNRAKIGYTGAENENLVIPETFTDTDGTNYKVTIISNNAFTGCTSLTSVTIPNSVTSIIARTFYDCRSLTSITIPSSVTSIGNYAFYNCTGLTTVNYTGSQEQWNAIVINTSGNDSLTNATKVYNYKAS